MIKRTFFALTLSVTFVAATTSCGSDSANSTAGLSQQKEAVNETVEVASIDGAELFTSSGCVACHQAAVKTVGPSIDEMKEAYGGNAAGLGAFLNGEGEAIIDPAQAAVMAPQVEITKAMTDQEREAIVAYLLQ